MDSKQRLLDLLGRGNFRFVDGSMSIEEFKDMIWHNRGQFANIEAVGDRYQEQILDLICIILAERLQPIMISRFGDASDSSLYCILRESLDTPEMRSEWETCKQTALAALGYAGLDTNQLEVISCIIDELPETIISLLIRIVGRLKVIPMQDFADISQTLLQMMKEGSYAGNKGYN